MAEYTYQTMWNGLTLEIFSSVSLETAFYQDDDASRVLDKLAHTQTDEEEQEILREAYEGDPCRDEVDDY